MLQQYYDEIFYHIYPFGFCNVPDHNNFQDQPVNRLENLYRWLEHMRSMGITALYLGPVFESTSHGYDTADWYRIDRRLGSNQDFQNFCRELKKQGIKLILDAVFHHTGRDFWAFRDVREKKQHSPYVDWFAGIDFSRQSPYNDGFSYEAWEGHYNLVKLNLKNQDLKKHILDAVLRWMDEFLIDGLRLDVAYALEGQFLEELALCTKSRKADFLLLGEVIHGDYRNWAQQGRLDSVTNYECFKSIYSSHKDINLFEITWSLQRQFGSTGMYRHIPLYNFLDNHDVNRITNLLGENTCYLYTSYLLLFTIPGIPSIYYGSEWGIRGMRSRSSDKALRPAKEQILSGTAKEKDLPAIIKKLISIRKSSAALRYGSLQVLHNDHTLLIFSRNWNKETIIIIVNIENKTKNIDLQGYAAGKYIDLLNTGEEIHYNGGSRKICIYPHWGRILKAV